MKKNNFEFIVFYVEDCSPKFKKLSSVKKLTSFLNKFNKLYGINNNDGYWIDYIVQGKYLSIDNVFERINHE